MPTSARCSRLPAAEPSPPSMPSVSPSSAALSPPDRDAKRSSTSPALVRTLTKAPLEWGAWLDAAIGSVIAAGAPRPAAIQADRACRRPQRVSNYHVEAGRDVALDLVEELAELLGSMARHALADHGAGLHVRP